MISQMMIIAIMTVAEEGMGLIVIILSMMFPWYRKNRIALHEIKEAEPKTIDCPWLFGTVEWYQPISRHKVLIQIQDVARIIELEVSEPWIICRGDSIVVSGEDNKSNGKYMAYAYKNMSKGVIGSYGSEWILGTVFLLLGIGFFYAIFPLLFFMMGIKMLNKGFKTFYACRVVKGF
jgi:hypothetical protein